MSKIQAFLAILAFLLTVLIPNVAYSALSKEDIEEIRHIIREEVDVLRKEINVRFEDTNARINDLREDVNARFSWLYILLSSIIALNGVMVGSVILLARQDRPVTRRHYEQILAREDEMEKSLLSLQKEFDTHLKLAHKA